MIFLKLIHSIDCVRCRFVEIVCAIDCLREEGISRPCCDVVECCDAYGSCSISNFAMVCLGLSVFVASFSKCCSISGVVLQCLLVNFYQEGAPHSELRGNDLHSQLRKRAPCLGSL